jgi:hypothetical protein
VAINLNTNPTYTGRITAPSLDYPYASSKNESPVGSNNGTPYEIARANDIFGMQQALLESANIVPSGNPDTVLDSEYVKSIVEIASGRAINYNETGIADAYVLDIKSKQQPPASLFDGLTIKFTPGNLNTGASTIDVASLGIVNLKDFEGVDLLENILDPVKSYTAVFNLASNEFRLNRLLPVVMGDNLIINGGFTINQRGYVSATPTIANDEYTLDRWKVLVLGQNLSFTGVGPNNTVTCPAGGLGQIIEDINIRGGTYTISWVGTATCTVNAVAKVKGESFTLPVDTNVIIIFSSGTLAEVKFEPGFDATSFDYRDISKELLLCQRYYEIVGFFRESLLALYSSVSTKFYAMPIVYKVEKRVSPSIIYVNDAVGTEHWKIPQSANFTAASSAGMAFGNSTKSLSLIHTRQVGGSAPTNGGVYAWGASTLFLADAEL